MQLNLLQSSSNASPYGNSPYRHHSVVERRPSAALLSTVQLTNPEEAAEVCNREDSAMHLADERLSNSGARHTVIPVFCQGTDTRTSSSSLKVCIPAMAARAVLMLHICMLIQPAPQVPQLFTLCQVFCHTAYMDQVCADSAAARNRTLVAGYEVLLLKKAQLLPVVFHCY